MDYALGMNEVNGRHEFPCNAAGFSLGEMFLAANTMEQLSTGQQLHHHVHVQLMKPVNRQPS